MKSLLVVILVLATRILFAESWTQRSDFPDERSLAVSFSIGSRGYMGLGYKHLGNLFKDWWSFDPSTNIWTQQADFPGSERCGAFGFAIGSKGYTGCGQSLTITYQDFYEYDPLNNTWNAKSNFPTMRTDAVSFSIGGKGYTGCGLIALNKTNDFWEYDPLLDTWISKATFPGFPRSEAIGFSINGKGYIGLGNDTMDNFVNDFYEYDSGLNAWTNRADFVGSPFSDGSSFVISNCGYVLAGHSNELWQFNTITNSWIRKLDFAGIQRWNASAFEIDGKGYVCAGDYVVLPNGAGQTSTFWEYTPDSLNAIDEIDFFKDLNIFYSHDLESLSIITENKIRIIVYTEEGKILWDDEVYPGKLQIQTDTWASSVYLVHAERNDRSIVRKILKQ